jgi:putative transposase
MRAYKFRIYPTKLQDIEMRRHLWIAKELWNDLLEHTKNMYRDFGIFPTRNALQLMVKNAGLFSQTQQETAHRINDATKRFMKPKKEGKKAGFPRFKSFDRMKSLHYPQAGFSLSDKLKVTPFGEIKIVQHRSIEGTIKTLALKRESSGKWYAILTVEESPMVPRINACPEVGIDVGLKCFARLSNDERISNPRHFNKYQDRLTRVQREVSRKKKGSRNRNKAKKTVAIIHEKIQNARNDFLHKTSTRLVNDYSMIALEKLDVQEMMGDGLGKSIGDAGWARFATLLSYKAENAGSKIVFVNPAGTTKTCHRCGHVQDMPLEERIYNCPDCGLTMDRDLNAAKNILARATLGYSGSNAPGDGTDVPS